MKVAAPSALVNIRVCQSRTAVSHIDIEFTIVRRWSIMKCLAFGLLFVAVVYSTELSLKETTKDKSTQVNVTESERENIETVSIDVRRVEVDRDQNGGFEDARILKVREFVLSIQLAIRLIDYRGDFWRV